MAFDIGEIVYRYKLECKQFDGRSIIGHCCTHLALVHLSKDIKSSGKIRKYNFYYSNYDRFMFDILLKRKFSLIVYF